MRSFLVLSALLALGCSSQSTVASSSPSMTWETAATSFDAGPQTLDFQVSVPVTGRYRVVIELDSREDGLAWLEAYPGNPDGRCYDITGPISVKAGAGNVTRDGSPLAAGPIPMRLHVDGAGCHVKDVRFELLREHTNASRQLVQSTEGDEWVLAWSDEFNGEGLPDQDTWTHDLGNWGWGNRELQYYTEGDTRNARQENGRLIIEAHPQEDGSWTSARLTTRGKIDFLYGKIVMRTKAPSIDGTWAAGWTLGSAYRDELSWPYCGEIDICEAVGREIDDLTGSGINHASCHTRAYYFKQGNHISNKTPVEAMSTDFHEYTCEWDEDEVRMYVDGEHYYTYDKTANELEWPFASPQCLILNLAIGGGMGGPVAEGAGSQRFEIDYVRVYEKQ